MGGRDPSERVVVFNRNEWSRSIGIAGRDQPVRARTHLPQGSAPSIRSAAFSAPVALSRPSRFFIAVPSAASADVWFVVESADPRRPVAPHSSEAEAWRVAEEMNEREIKQRARRFAICSASTSTARESYRLQSQRLR